MGIRNAPDFDRGVVAFGGNAIAQGRDLFSQDAVTYAMGPTLDLFKDRGLAIVHGNGPQVGAIRREVADSGERMSHADVTLATQDRIGGLFMEAMRGCDRAHEIHYTRVIVDPEDPTFSSPVKGIGEWEVGRQRFDGLNVSCVQSPRDTRLYREAVASPASIGIVDEEKIQKLVNDGCVLVCGGGGGIPVFASFNASHTGDEGSDGYDEAAGRIWTASDYSEVAQTVVVDKDGVAYLIGKGVGAQVMLILTDVDGFYEGYGTDNSSLVCSMTSDEVRQRIESNANGGGSMNPKLAAAAAFAASDSSRVAVISSLNNMPNLAQGNWDKATFVRDSNLLAF